MGYSRLVVIGAASSIGIRPYETGDARHLDRAPAALRRQGLVERLSADDLGDITSAPYRDFTRPPDGIRNEREVAHYSGLLAEQITAGLDGGRFPVVLGGDCSIVLGTLLGLTRRAARVGLAYIDAHADFATPQESRSGSAASMCLALSAGRGQSPLATLAGSRPLVRADDVVLIGRRDHGQGFYGHAALAASGILDLPGSLVGDDPAAVVRAALEQLVRPELDGFWIHVDADVLDPRVMPAVDSPEPGGPGIDELVAILTPLARHPSALGMQLTIYDPALDADRSCASRLVTLLERTLAGDMTGGSR
ncbi:MAG TPA: arginase family protein [Vicinamibacterales bacterium]|jgi:arginase|nr:arginase family protein [Vicinamibacterales bacterium]